MTVETHVGKITATKEMLNLISMAFSADAKLFRNGGYNCAADSRDRIAHKIYVALEKAGYYSK